MCQTKKTMKIVVIFVLALLFVFVAAQRKTLARAQAVALAKVHLQEAQEILQNALDYFNIPSYLNLPPELEENTQKWNYNR
jgi:sensor domain CHASE-containing protein